MAAKSRDDKMDYPSIYENDSDHIINMYYSRLFAGVIRAESPVTTQPSQENVTKTGDDTSDNVKDELKALRNGEPHEFFMKFLNDVFLLALTERINNSEISLDEMKTFIGLTLHTGTSKLGCIGAYWVELDLPISFNTYMTYFSFDSIYQDLKLGEADTIEMLINNFNQVMEDDFRMRPLDHETIIMKIDVNPSPFLHSDIFVHSSNAPPSPQLLLLTTLDGIINKIKCDKHFQNVGKLISLTSTLLESNTTCINLFVCEELTSERYFSALNSIGYSCTGILDNRSNFIPAGLKKMQLGIPEDFNDGAIEKEDLLVVKHALSKKKHIYYLSTDLKNTIKTGTTILAKSCIGNKCDGTKWSEIIENIEDYFPTQILCVDGEKIFGYVLMLCLVNAHMLFNKLTENKLSFHDFRIKVLEFLLPLASRNAESTIAPVSEYVIQDEDDD